MTIPLIILAILAIFAGFAGVPEVFGGHHELAHFLAPVFADSAKIPHEHHNEIPELVLMGVSVTVAALAILFAVNRFSKKPDMEDAQGFGKVLENKWYVDEIYDIIIVRP